MNAVLLNFNQRIWWRIKELFSLCQLRHSFVCLIYCCVFNKMDVNIAASTLYYGCWYTQ